MAADNEKLRFRVKCLEEETQKLSLRAEKKQQEASAALNDKHSCLALLKEKEILLDSQKRQLTQLREDLHARD